VKPGILNSVLVEQVRNTAAWLWQDRACASLTAVFDASADDPLEEPGALVRSLRLRLAAHYATVATFVPTDVDAHIRQLRKKLDRWSVVIQTVWGVGYKIDPDLVPADDGSGEETDVRAG